MLHAFAGVISRRVAIGDGHDPINNEDAVMNNETMTSRTRRYLMFILVASLRDERRDLVVPQIDGVVSGAVHASSVGRALFIAEVEIASSARTAEV